MVKGASPRLNTPNNLSAYEKKRLATIDANRKVLEELGLLDDVQAMRNSMKKAPASQKTSKQNKHKPVIPRRETSGRSEILEAEKQREKEAEARRKAIEEAAAEERREHMKKLRKEREKIARFEAAKEAKRKAKLEEERKARQRALAEARRERDAEMREQRRARAELVRAQRQEMRRIQAEAAKEEKRQRTEEERERRAAMVQEIRERKAALRHENKEMTNARIEETMAKMAVRMEQREESRTRAAEQREHEEVKMRKAMQIAKRRAKSSPDSSTHSGSMFASPREIAGFDDPFDDPDEYLVNFDVSMQSPQAQAPSMQCSSTQHAMQTHTCKRLAYEKAQPNTQHTNVHAKAHKSIVPTQTSHLPPPRPLPRPLPS